MMIEFRRFAVCGKPILHSRSPDLFNAYFQAVGLKAAYSRLAVDSAAEAFALCQRLGLQGMNVTAPFKVAMCELVDEVDPDAIACGALNTVIRHREQWQGFNTDKPGVIQALRERGFNPAGKECLVLGAGGAARAATRGLLSVGASVTLINRTFSRAEAAATQLGCRAEPWSTLQSRLRGVQLLISTLPAGVSAVENTWLHSDLVLFEAAYPASALLQEAVAIGCTVLSGEEWLLAQAVHAGSLFLEETPDSRLLAEALAHPARRQEPPVIALIGFMGTGKSTVCRELARELDCSCCDLDGEIEQRSGSDIPTIFREQGEPVFRKLETHALRRAVEGGSQIIACGGGILNSPANRHLLAERCLTIWLSASLERCLERIEPGSRPLLEGPAPADEAARLFSTREPDYFSSADLIINADNGLQQVTGKIADEIRHAFPPQR